MPSNVSRVEERADIEPSNLGTRLDHDASGSSKAAASGDSKAAKTSAHMASANKNPSGAQPEDSLDNVDKSESRTPNAARANKSNSNNRDDSLQVPDIGKSNSRRPIETSIWDWDTPLDSVGESTSYYYEPQGELLKEQRPVRGEFSIPTVVPGSGMNWPFQGANGSSESQDFARPRRPTGNTSASLLRLKRKSTSEQLPTISKTDKRMSRTMSDSGEDAGSPTDPRPPAHNTRSQSGPSTGGRGSTEASDSRPRPQNIDVESLRPPFGSASAGAGPRRMTDPGVPMVLPARKVFPIQIGDKLFRLSGASISSDGEYHTLPLRSI